MDITKIMTMDIKTFVPRFPWNDDERDTSSFIDYYAKYDNNVVDDDYDYVPTYVIMKEYFQEQQQRLCCQEADYIDEQFDCYNPYAHIGNYDSDDESNYSESLCSINSSSDIDDLPSKSDDDDTVSSPYISSKYWYL